MTLRGRRSKQCQGKIVQVFAHPHQKLRQIFFLCDYCDTDQGKELCDYTPKAAVSFLGKLFLRKYDSWRRQLDYYWANMIQDTTRWPYPGPQGAFIESVRTAFDNYKKEMPEGRGKYLFPYGSVCKFSLKVNENSPYTGLLAPGTVKGIVRMSNNNGDPDGNGFAPAIGLKIPRSGVPSGDSVSMDALYSNGWDFFKRNLSTHAAGFEPGTPQSALGLAVTHKFSESSQCTSKVGTSFLARYTQDGEEIENKDIRFPFKLVYRPGKKLLDSPSPETTDQVHETIAGFEVGTTLYEVWACAKPDGAEIYTPSSFCGGAILLGEMKTISECTQSLYGDTKLEVRHQRVEEDWKLEPDYYAQGEYHSTPTCVPDGFLPPTVDGTPERCDPTYDGFGGFMLNTDAGV